MYGDIEVKYTPHHNPDLIMHNELGEKRIDLTQYKTTEELHVLLQNEGFLKDYRNLCQMWANAGECTKNPEYMMSSCEQACNDVKREL